MDRLDHLSDGDLAIFFRRNKTAMSCMDNPDIFLNQLRDHDLIPDKLVKKAIKMDNKEKSQVVYKILKWFEKNKGQKYMKAFWRCVFQQHILQKNSILCSLKSNLEGFVSKQDPHCAEKLSKIKTNEVPKEKKEAKEKKSECSFTSFPDAKKAGEKRKKSDEEKKMEMPGPSSLSKIYPIQYNSPKNPNGCSTSFSNEEKQGENKKDFAEEKEMEMPRPFFFSKLNKSESSAESESESSPESESSSESSPELEPELFPSFPDPGKLNKNAESSPESEPELFPSFPDPEKLNKNKKQVEKQEKKTGAMEKKSVTEGTKTEMPGPSFLLKPTQIQRNLATNPSFCFPDPEKLNKNAESSPESEPELFPNPQGSSENQLQVTCGDKVGTLYKDQLSKDSKAQIQPQIRKSWDVVGEKCILSNDQWFTPGEFERYAGKGSYKNWKLSIRCQNTPLQKLIKFGHIQAPRAKKRCVRKSQKVLFPDFSSESSSSSEIFSHTFSEVMEVSYDDQKKKKKMSRVQEDDEDVEEEEQSDSEDLSLFDDPSLPVSCGSVSGVLCKQRFTGQFTKSIRTEEGWFTPEEFVKQVLTDGLWKKDILCHGKTINYLTMKKILYLHSVNCQCDRCCSKSSLDQNNDDVCFICNSGGKLVCCDGCPRSFHESCHLPEVEDQTPGNDWRCTFCFFKTYQGLFLPMARQAVLDSFVSRNAMRCEYLLLCMYKADKQRVFTEDPRATVVDYRTVIANPMWLDRVKLRLKNKRYKTVREFVDDILLIFHNCTIFNKENKFGKMASRLNEIFEQKFQEVFKIQ